MSFLLRAALVIGALSYLALQRQGGPSPAPPRAPTAGIASGTATGDAMDRLTTGGIGALVNAVNALPPEAREEMVRAGADAVARHVADQFAGQAAGQAPSPRPSADTLSASDRQPSWRGPTSH